MPESEEELRHNYLRRTEKERQEQGKNGRHPLAGMAEVFYGGDFTLLRMTASSQVDYGKPKAK